MTNSHTPMAPLDWLTARPVAHRGLHDAEAGIIENTPSAIAAAVAAGYSIEVDLQITADDDAVVHHDDKLGRLTEGCGRLAAMSLAELKRVPFKATADRMMSLHELCDLVAGRVTLLLELKSRFDGDRRLPARVADVLKNYAGPVAVMSFDPKQVDAVRQADPRLTRGVVAERHDPERHDATLRGKCALLLQGVRAAPQFIAYSAKDLPAAAPLLGRCLFGLPLLAWTVRSEAERRAALRWADQVIFERFRP